MSYNHFPGTNCGHPTTTRMVSLTNLHTRSIIYLLQWDLVAHSIEHRQMAKWGPHPPKPRDVKTGTQLPPCKLWQLLSTTPPRNSFQLAFRLAFHHLFAFACTSLKHPILIRIKYQSHRYSCPNPLWTFTRQCMSFQTYSAH